MKYIYEQEHKNYFDLSGYDEQLTTTQQRKSERINPKYKSPRHEEICLKLKGIITYSFASSIDPGGSIQALDNNCMHAKIQDGD